MAQRQHTVVSERDLAQVLCRSGREAEDRRAKKDIWSCDGEDESPRRRRDQARREWYRMEIDCSENERPVETGDRRRHGE